MENNTDADYTDAKRVSKDFEIKYLGEYHDLQVWSDTLLLLLYLRTLDFSYMCHKIWIWFHKFFFSYWISMASGFKKD